MLENSERIAPILSAFKAGCSRKLPATHRFTTAHTTKSEKSEDMTTLLKKDDTMKNAIEVKRFMEHLATGTFKGSPSLRLLSTLSDMLFQTRTRQ